MRRSEQRDELHRIIGSAIDAWASLEEGLAYFLQIISLTPNPYIAFSIYYASSAFKARLDTVDGVAKIALADTDFLPEWKRVRERISRKSSMRNKIVHLSPIMFASEGGEVTTGVYYSSSHPNYDREFSNFGSTGLTDKQIADFVEQTQKLRTDQSLLTVSVRQHAEKVWYNSPHLLGTRRPLAPRTPHQKDSDHG